MFEKMLEDQIEKEKYEADEESEEEERTEEDALFDDSEGSD